MQFLQKLFRAILIIMIVAGMAATLKAKEVKLKITGP
jgi:hypothetical protein